MLVPCQTELGWGLGVASSQEITKGIFKSHLKKIVLLSFLEARRRIIRKG